MYFEILADFIGNHAPCERPHGRGAFSCVGKNEAMAGMRKHSQFTKRDLLLDLVGKIDRDERAAIRRQQQPRSTVRGTDACQRQHRRIRSLHTFESVPTPWQDTRVSTGSPDIQNTDVLFYITDDVWNHRMSGAAL